MFDFSKQHIMLIKHQPMEAYFCLHYPSEHGNLCSTMPVEGPLSASPLSGEYGEIDLVSPSPYLVRVPCSSTCHQKSSKHLRPVFAIILFACLLAL